MSLLRTAVVRSSGSSIIIIDLCGVLIFVGNISNRVLPGNHVLLFVWVLIIPIRYSVADPEILGAGVTECIYAGHGKGEGEVINWITPSYCKSQKLYSRPSIIRTSLIRTLDYPNYQINDIHSICGVHQIEHISPPIENILFHISEYSVI